MASKQPVLIATLVTAATAIAVACFDATGPGIPRYTRVSGDWVAGAAAAAVDPGTGLFLLETPAGEFTSRQRADTFAVALARGIGDPSNAGNARAVLENDRGSVIEWSELHSCARPIYVVGPAQSLPPGVPATIARVLRAHWGITLCGSDGTAQLAIGVSDSPIRAALTLSSIDWENVDSSAGLFSLSGVPRRYPLGMPIPPEDAVRFAYLLTGLRTVKVPAAFNQFSESGIGWAPLCSSWVLELEDDVAIVGEESGHATIARTFFVRRTSGCGSDSLKMFLPLDTQPPTIWYRRLISTDPTVIDSVEVPITGPVRFERVRLQ